jgi:hypothetical protein
MKKWRKKSSRRGPRQVGRLSLSPERGQKAAEPPRKWSQGRPGQKPQEENCPAQRTPPAVREAPQGGMSGVIASIRVRFGYRAIGLGYGGIRFSAGELR